MPTGGVTLIDDDTVVTGTEKSLDGGGAASFDITDRFAIGEHNIMAVYEGDDNYAGVITFLKVNHTPRPR